MSNHIEEKVLLGFGDEQCGCNLEPASLRERSDGGYDILCKNGYPIPQDDYLMQLLLSRSLAVAGIPTESLGEVKKAMIAYQFMRDECDKQVSVAIEQRKEGDDFGKLINALIDSVNQS